MKNKLNVFITVFVAYLGGFGFGIDGGHFTFWTGLNLFLIVVNLWMAGFFEDSK